MELLGQGASINCYKGSSNKTLLHLVAHQGYTHMAEWLVRNGADHTARNNYNETPAELSNRSGDGSVARVIEEFLKR